MVNSHNPTNYSITTRKIYKLRLHECSGKRNTKLHPFAMDRFTHPAVLSTKRPDRPVVHVLIKRWAATTDLANQPWLDYLPTNLLPRNNKNIPQKSNMEPPKNLVVWVDVNLHFHSGISI